MGQLLSIEYADYQNLPHKGPTYVARLMVDFPSKKIEIKIENFDYRHSAPDQSTPKPETPSLPSGN